MSYGSTKIFRTAIGAALCACAYHAHAATLLGLYAAADYWYPSHSTADQYSNVHTQRHGQAMLSAALEHGVPFLPNLRVRYADLSQRTQSGARYADYSLTSTDIIAYYELLDNVVEFDFGVGTKTLEGQWETHRHTLNWNQSLPTAYTALGVNLPLGFRVKTENLFSKNTDTEVSDTSAEIQYKVLDTLALDVGLKIGYRVLDIKNARHPSTRILENSQFKGPYAGIHVHF